MVSEHLAPPENKESLKEYDRIILRVFRQVHSKHEKRIRLPFTKSDIERAAVELDLEIKNIPDIVYTYRTGRSPLPQAVQVYGHWAIDAEGKGKYAFVRLNRSPYVDIPTDIETTLILDATPQIVLKYQSSDEQAILTRIRYNRLVDTFTSLTAYHIQGHFRTTVQQVGLVEIDDLYIGVNTEGHGFVLPIEAKSESPKLDIGENRFNNKGTGRLQTVRRRAETTRTRHNFEPRGSTRWQAIRD